MTPWLPLVNSNCVITVLCVQVDSYGKCLRNARFPDGTEPSGTSSHPASPLVPLMAEYKFVLAFENAQEQDYVTEKFYIPLLAGSVPVYLGAPNAAAFAPDPLSFISVRDFAGPAELAAQLEALGSDPEAYAALHAWRHRPPSAAWLAVAAMGLNQGSVYNEGAVHGSAQRVDPARISQAAARLLSHTQQSPTRECCKSTEPDDLNAHSADTGYECIACSEMTSPNGIIDETRKVASSPLARSCRGLRTTVEWPADGIGIRLGLLSGLKISVRVHLDDLSCCIRDPGQGYFPGSLARSDDECAGGAVTVVLLLDQAVHSQLQVLIVPSCRGNASFGSNGSADENFSGLSGLGNTELEGIGTGQHVLRAVVKCHDEKGDAAMHDSASIRFMILPPTCDEAAAHSHRDPGYRMSHTRTDSCNAESGNDECANLSNQTRESSTESKDGPNMCDVGELGWDEGLGGSVAVVNLLRRPDRWAHTTNTLAAAGIRNATRVQAVDGRELSATWPGPKWLFRRNHFGSQPAVMGCALSHARIWLRMVSPPPSSQANSAVGDSSAEAGREGSEGFVLVLEDDVELAEGFVGRLREAVAQLEGLGGWDLLCVGARQSMSEFVDFDSDWAAPGVMRIRNYRNCHTHAYALRRTGAAALLEAAARDGVICGLDWFMAIQHGRLRAYALMPALAGQKPDVARATDIAEHAAAWGAASAALQLAEAGIA